MINLEMRKKLKKVWLWVAIVCASAAVWAVIFYWAAQTPSTLSFEIWVGSNERLIDDGLYDELENVCKDGGMKEFTVRYYDPNDYYYGSAFALQQRAVEVFILNGEEALTIAETGLFLDLATLGDLPKDGLLEYGGATIGVKFSGEYYILINSLTKKDVGLISSVLEKMIAGEQ